MRRRRTPQTDDAEGRVIDLTPMLDIVFIMLIFFIVTASFVNEAGIKVQRPAAQTGQAQGDSQVMIAIKPNGEVWLDKRPVDIRAIRAYLLRMQGEHPLGSAVIAADRATQAYVLVAVMDQVRLAGVEDIAIATEAESR